MKKCPVVHFEMALEDKKRASDFYSQVFGWDMQQMGDEWGGYTMAITTESTETGPIKPGAINGGFYEKKPGENPAPHIIISVDDLEESKKMVQEHGGELDGEQQEIPHVGLFQMIKDSEGNRVGLLQPSMN